MPPSAKAPTGASPNEASHFSREQILNEAIKLLEEHGTLGFRLHDLAQRLGVTVSALYYHFRNRDAIIQEAFVEIFSRDTDIARDLIAIFATLDLNNAHQHETITEMVERFLSPEVRELRRTRFTALTSLPGTAHGREEVDASLRRANEATTAAYRESQARGLVRDDLEPEALALFVRVFLAGLIVWDYDTSLTVTPEQFARVLEVLLPSLRATRDT